MGHEVLMYGVIVGAHRRSGEDFRSLYPRNAKVIESLPSDDDHPWVDRSIFAMPGDYPNGTYRSQAIHFGLTMKDDPYDLDALIAEWLSKFERVLSQLYWFSATLHVVRDFPGGGTYQWSPTDESLAGLLEDPPKPISNWQRTFRPG
ncbi:hypothetical protein [Bremerella sp. P1]|uniref:hypothetical protein n=1 Tax=Bremerella sp. P1 TaxID=3026424 RepID=UPI002367B901|nr:hypothetical protein [Bremerella sp. P1]WDI44201.1 hypothetical protein PSR63_09680 [Bremerella sp. P1]